MNFGKFDMVILIVMSVAIVVMSFVFPALGLADAETSESDIPEFTMDTERFDFAGDFPSRVGTPSTSTLRFDTSRDAGLSDNVIWLSRDGDQGTQMTLVENASTDNAQVNLFLLNETDTLEEDTTILNETGDADVLEIDFEGLAQYEIYVELIQDEEVTGGTIYEVEYQIREQPEAQESGGWLDRIPILGGIIDGGETLAGMVGWIGAVIWWLFTSFWELVLNVLGIAFDIVTFLFGTTSWLFTTYGAVLSAAESWVAVFIALPGLLLGLVWVKLAMIVISLLPTT